jgi:Pyruvate/2-oxoacid:ferredoxin oxidoreductase gamma subunit
MKTDAARDRRALRPLLQGIHAGDGEGGLRRAAQRHAAEEPLHGRHHRRRDAHQPAYDRLRHRSPKRPRVFYGLGADGTVGANKNSIKIIGEETPNYAQGYFVYDSKKSGAITVSHLRFGPRPSARLPDPQANFVAVPPVRLPRPLRRAQARRTGAVLPAQQPLRPDEVWDHLPRDRAGTHHRPEAQVLHRSTPTPWPASRHGPRINTVMQTCFFAISGVLPARGGHRRDQASIKKTYGKRGEAVVQRTTPRSTTPSRTCTRCNVPAEVTSTRPAAARAREAPDFVQRVTAPMIAGNGRRAARQRAPRRRHLARPPPRSGRSAHRPRDPVWDEPISASSAASAYGLPARRHPRQGLRPRRARPMRPETVQVGHRPQGPRVQGPGVHHPGRARGLHRLHAVRRGLPGQGQEPEVAARRSTCALSPAARAERENWDFFLRPARRPPQAKVNST